MLKNHIYHITGNATVHKNNLFYDILSPNTGKPRTLGETFFKPYESKKEFIFCARNTFQPVLLVGFSVLDPLFPAYLALFEGVMISSLLATSAISLCTGDKLTASISLRIAERIFSDCCQALINIIVFPAAALLMLTRGISTGLKAAKIFDYDKVGEPTSNLNAAEYPGCDEDKSRNFSY